jgi:hypothetical protein
MSLTNNDIIKKIRVALKLRDDDIVEILKLVDFKISKGELGAFFRREDHPSFMKLKDQILRNFLNGLVIYKRGPMPKKPDPENSVTEKPDKRKAVYKKPNQKNTSTKKWTEKPK